MENLDPVIMRLNDIDDQFFGQVVITVRQGRAVRIEEQRVFQLDSPAKKAIMRSPRQVP